MDEKTQAHLLAQLDSPDPKLRYEAVLKLGKTGNLDLLPPLGRVATYDEHAKIRDLAAKAVRTLEILQERQVEKQKQALIEQGDDLKTVDWNPLASSQLLDNESYTNRPKEQVQWSYVESKKQVLAAKEEEARRKAEAKQAERLQREAERKARAKENYRRRRLFRIFLYLTTTFAVIVFAFLAWYVRFVDTAPSNEADVVRQLDSLVNEQKLAITAYQEGLLQDPIVCSQMKAIPVPNRPLWMGLRENTKRPQAREDFFGQTADNLSRIDEGILLNLAPLVEAVDESDFRLQALKDQVLAACEGAEELLPSEWEAFVAVASASDEVRIWVDTTAFVLQNEKIQVPPTNSDEVLDRLQLWSDEQVISAKNYEELFAADPLNCPALLQIALPETPRWIASGQVDVAILGDSQAIFDALDEANGNLQGVKLGVDRICAGKNLLNHAEAGNALPATAQNLSNAIIKIDAARFVLEAALKD